MVEILIDQIFEDIVETIREPLLVLDSDLKVISASRSFYEFFKVRPEETVGQLIYDLGNKQWDIPKLRELLETILPEKTSFDNYEVEHDFTTIGRRVMLLNARQIERAMGKERIILLAIEDITKRSQLEDLLEESEFRYRCLFETADDGILLLEKRELKIHDANPTIMAMLDYSNEELIGKDMKDIGFSDDIGTFQEIMQVLNKDGILHCKDVAVQNKAGQVINTDIYMTDRAILVQCNIRDITERKKAEKSLKESEENFRILFDNAPDLIVSFNSEGNFLNLNKKFEEESGYSREEMIGKSVFTSGILTESSVNMSIPYFEELLAGKKWALLEVEGVTKGGSKIPYELMAVPIKKDGKIVAVQATLRNITERKQADQEKEKLKAQFLQAQKMEAIGTLAGGVAHDFNNLLTAILGYAELSLMGLGKDDSLRENIEEIKKAGNSAASLTRQLLAFSRKQIVQPKVIDLNEFLSGMKMLGRLLSEDIELLTIPEPALWPVKTDPGQMEQIIMNLAVNARDAMPMGGNLTIETANMDLDENYFREHGIREEQPGSYVILAVSDTGSGMDKETQEHIFEPFFTTKELGKGTGLGLSTVYGIVKQNNGFIWVYSEPGQGTTFKVYLPKVEGDTGPEEKERAPIEDLDGSETVLIVEDDGSLRKLARTILKEKGYKVLEAENGEEALKVSEAHDGMIDLMITDVVMPKMGGKEIAERLQPLYPQMKVIYMSGYTDNAIVHHGVLAPGLNFLEKPFSPKVLARKVREVLDK